MGANPLFLYDTWYLALPGKELKPGKAVSKTLLGQGLLIGRSETGEAFALLDVCPHRGMPLSYGQFNGKEIKCRYHGWRFNTDGFCTAIPSLVPDQPFNVSRIKVFKFPCQEVQGNIWVYMPEPNTKIPDTLPDIFKLPGLDHCHQPQLIETKLFPCDIDHAVVGLMDPAHGPFIHRSWWWRDEREIHIKAKEFAPAPMGFQMVRHSPSRNSKAYRLLGEVSTEITFRLPGIRVEHIKAGRRDIFALTTLTPITETTTQIHQFFYWSTPWLNLAKPILKYFTRAFLYQDYAAIKEQQDGLKANPQLMLIHDADTQAKWYYRLKDEYERAKKENRAFVNPVKKTVLRWRS